MQRCYLHLPLVSSFRAEAAGVRNLRDADGARCAEGLNERGRARMPLEIFALARGTLARLRKDGGSNGADGDAAGGQTAAHLSQRFFTAGGVGRMAVRRALRLDYDLPKSAPHRRITG
jgi:hypothetical protein